MKAILTKYHGPGNVKGSRISAFDLDGNRATVSLDHALDSDDNHRRAALALCEKMDWAGVLVGGAIRGGYAFTFCDDRTKFSVFHTLRPA
jgi:hypothetical protein